MTKHTITLQVALNLEPIEDVSLAEIEHHLQWSVLRDYNEGCLTSNLKSRYQSLLDSYRRWRLGNRSR